MNREAGSRSKLDKFHLKQIVQKIMHRFLELYQDCVLLIESTVWCKAKNVSAKLHDVLQMKRFI